MRQLWLSLLTLGWVAALACDSAEPGSLIAPSGVAGMTGGSLAPAAGGAPGAQAGTAPAASGQGGAGSSAGAGPPPPTGGAGMTAGAGGMPDAAIADAGADSGAAPDGCDRACLIAVMSSYLDALAAQDASSLPLSASLKYTENGETAEVGQGLWTTASALRPDTRLDFADPQEGQVASQLVLDENGSTPVIYQVRLKVVDDQITEIESMSVRQRDAANGFFSIAGMTPQPVFKQEIAASDRMTREQLKVEVDLYLDYLDDQTNSSGVHLDTNCARYENGLQTASGTSFARQNWSFDVVRRYLVFDEEAGIVWGMFPFTPAADTLVVGEAFKVVKGKIMMIQAVMAYMPTMAW